MKNIAILGDSLIGLLSALVLSKNENNIYIFRIECFHCIFNCI